MAKKREIIITCNAKQVQDTFEFLNKSLAVIKAKMNALNEKGAKDGWTEQMKKDFAELEKMATSINNFDLAPAEKAVRKFEDVLRNLAGSTLKDVKRALNEGKSDLNKMAENDPNRQKLTDDLRKIAEQIKVISGTSMSLKEAKQQLNDLANTPTEKLVQGLERLKAEYASLKGAQINGPQGAILRGDMQNYEAQIALNKLGSIPTWNPKTSGLNVDQLKQEYSRLQQAYSAVSRGPEYGAEATQIHNQMQAITAEIQRQAEAERQLTTERQKAAQVTDVLTRVNQNQKVTIDELRTAEKNLQDQIVKMEGQNLPFADQNKLLQAKASLQDIQETISHITLDHIDFDSLENKSLEELDKILKQIEADEKRLAGTDELASRQMAENKRKVQQAIQRVKNQTLDLANAQKVAGERGKHSVQDMQRAYDTLKQHLMTLSTSQTKDIAKTKKQMADLKTQIDQVTGAVKQQSTAWNTAIKNITAYVGVFGAFNFIKGKIMDVFKANEQLSDSLANIRKVSGLTAEEIDQLYTNIAKVDTRNSIEQLNELAYVGAKLGIQEHGGVAALTGFVKAAEQVQMALGEDLGEEALPAMAKLTEVMGLITQYGVEEAMQKAASAIFMLSTTSTSTGANIVEFSKRLMGLANVSHITADELLALGSASDAMGLMPEVSATAFNKVFTKIQSNTEGIEKAVGLTKGSLKELVNEGKTMEAIVTVFDKMREMSMEEMQKRGIFTELGSDGARLNNVMTTMADRVDMLKKHLQESNKAFGEGEAVIAEYMIQNQTAAAYMERAANLWEKAFTNPEGVDAVSGLAQQWHELTKQMTESSVMMGSLKSSLWLIIQAVKGLIVILPTLINFLMFKGSLMAITNIVNGFISMSKAIWAAATASKALTAAQKWNGITTALSLIAAAFVTIKGAADEANEAAERARQRQEELAKAFAQSKETVARSTKGLEEYKKAIDDANLSQDERDKRLKAYLRNEYQGYLDYLGIEIDKVEDLADAYAQVVYAIKQKAAAEEKQNYLNNVNGENRYNRIAAQAEVIRQASTIGLKIGKEDIEKFWSGDNNESVQYAYEKLLREHNYTPYGEEVTVNGQKARPVKYNGLLQALDKYAGLFLEEQKVANQVEKMFNEEYKDLDLEHFSLEDFREKQLQAEIEREKNRKETILPTITDPKEQKEIERQEKEALRKDLQDAKADSDAIISKIEEWYRLQETVITDMQADGKLTKEQADQAVRTLNIAKNTALRDARLAISGRDTKAWEETKKQIGNLMLDQGQWSQELLQQILDVSMESIRANLAKIDAGGGKYGITTSSLKDAVDKNAAGNQREIARLMARSQQEVEKIFMEYDFFEQAMRGFSNRLAQMGILSETARQMAERLSDANNPDIIFSMKDYDALLKGNEGAKQQMLQAFIRSGATPYGVNPEDKDQLRTWFMEFVGQFVQKEGASPFGENMTNVEYEYQSWAKPFEADFELWLRDSDKYLSSIQSFYFSLMKSEEDYYEKRKQSYNFYKKQLDQQDMVAGIPTQREDAERQLQAQATLQDNGIGASFWRQQGLGGILNDPEVMLIQQRIEWRNQDLESAKALLAGKEALWEQEKAQRLANGESEADIDADLAQRRMGFEDLIKERQTSLFEQQLNLTTKIAQEMRKRVQTVNQLTKPIQDGALNIGKKFGEMLAGVEEQSMTWKEIWRSMAVAVGESVIDMTAQYAQNLIMEKAMNAQSKQEAIDKATVDVAAGTASGAAKTIGQLGWWGIALVPVIAALLKGLLQAAFASNKKSESAASSTTATSKTKLVSGMLTYDRGNVDKFAGRRKLYDDGETQVYGRRRYLGEDGKVYTATAEPAPKDGLITHPIATTVQGQPALVAENGPEIVIGRETTKAIMMNEPDLIRYIANYDRMGGKYGLSALRAYDQGTALSGFAAENTATVPDCSPSGDTLAALTAVVAQLSQTVQALQQKGVPAYINKYGTGGLIEEVKSGLKFDRRYNG